SYPRTDNTVYPASLPVHEILGRLRESAYGPYAERLLAQPSLEPSRGPIQTTDHPPVHPTAAPAKRRDSVRSRMYDLVARRFLATLSPASVPAVTEVRLPVGDSAFITNERGGTGPRGLPGHLWPCHRESGDDPPSGRTDDGDCGGPCDSRGRGDRIPECSPRRRGGIEGASDLAQPLDTRRDVP